MALSPKQFEMFTPVDKDGVEHKEFPAAQGSGKNEAVDYAYWMNNANPGSAYKVRR